MRPLPPRLMSAVSAAVRSPWLRAGFLIVAIALAVVAVIDQRIAVLDALARVSAFHFALAAAATVMNLGLAAVAWRAVMNDLGAPLSPVATARVYLVGQVGKYLPGGVWNLLAAAELGRDHGIARRQTVSSMLLAVVVSIATAAAVALATLTGLPFALLAPLPLVALHPVVLNSAIAILLKVARREPLTGALSARGSRTAAGWTLLSWLAIGGQVFVLAVAVGAPPDIQTLASAAGGYVLAWTVGTVAVVLPAGAGAREATLVLVLAPVVGVGAAVVIALLSRVLITLADLGLAGAALLAARMTQISRPPLPNEPT